MALEHITHCSFADTQWLQASLPIKDGGFGIRRVSSLALPAFLSSAAKTWSLQYRILANSPRCGCQYMQDYLVMWSSSFGEPFHPLPFKQSFWDCLSVELDRASVEASHDVPHQRIAFRAATACHSADWLFALPISSCALKVDDEAVRVAVGIRLGMVHKSMRVALIL